MLNRVASQANRFKQFSSTGGIKMKKALLLPSKIPIFPFQSHVSVISDEDKDTIKKLGFQNAVMSVEKQFIEEIDEHFMDIIKDSEKTATKLVSQVQMNDSTKPKSE